MKKKPTRGGARKGAGRKPRGAETRVRRSITLEPTAWAKLDADALRKGVSASELVNRWALRLR
jgi:predicted DNA-binding ribbon-helix-helix protein